MPPAAAAPKLQQPKKRRVVNDYDDEEEDEEEKMTSTFASGPSASFSTALPSASSTIEIQDDVRELPHDYKNLLDELGFKLYNKLRSELLPLLSLRENGIYIEYGIQSIDNSFNALNLFIELCAEFMKLFSLESAQDINYHLFMSANKFIYHLEKKIYEPLLTRIQENGYCLYHTATVLRLLENSAERDKVAIQGICGRTSMSLLGVDAMIATMEEMKNKLTLAIPLCASAESIDSEMDLRENQEFTDISIALWTAYKEEHIEALQHNLALEKGDKKGKKKKIPEIEFREEPWPEAEILLPLVLENLVVLYKPVQEHSPTGDILPVCFFDTKRGVARKYVEKNLTFKELLDLLLNEHNALNGEGHHEVFSYGREVAEDVLFRPALRNLDKLANNCFSAKVEVISFIYELLVEFQKECYRYDGLGRTSEYKPFQDLCDLYFSDRKYLVDMDKIAFEDAYSYYRSQQATITLFSWPPYHPVRPIRRFGMMCTVG